MAGYRYASFLSTGAMALVSDLKSLFGNALPRASPSRFLFGESSDSLQLQGVFGEGYSSPKSQWFQRIGRDRLGAAGDFAQRHRDSGRPGAGRRLSALREQSGHYAQGRSE